MPLWSRVRYAASRLLRPARFERELDDELRLAVDELAARYRERGLPPERAARAAREHFGAVDLIKEDVRSAGIAHHLETAARDVAYAWRGLRQRPVFTVTAVAVLAGGIGAATAIFSVVNALLLAPLPYREPDRLVFVWQDLTRAGYPRAPLAGPELQDLRDRSRLFTGFGGIWANTAVLTDEQQPEQIRVGLVTPDFFEILGAEPHLGRVFRPGDDAADASPSILLSGALWRRRFGGADDIVGRRILVNGRPTTVLGVMPEPFRLLLPPDSAIPDDQQAWLLLNRNIVTGRRQQQFLRVVGRLRPGVRLADGQAEVAAIAEQVGREYTEYGTHGATFYALGLKDEAMRELRPALRALLAGVCLLLVIGCVNVGGLLLTRATTRQHETAVRLAIGASRGRIFRQALSEGVLLALLGGAAGVLLSHALLALLVAMRPAALGRIDVATVDGRVLLLAASVSVGWGVLFSLAPFAQALRTNVVTALQGAGRDGVRTAGRRVRSGLVAVQVGICTVLLVAAVLLARGFYELSRVDLGFSDANVLTFKLSLLNTRHGAPETAAVFSRQLREKLASLPGVTSVGATSHLPYDTVPNWGTSYLPEHVSDETLVGLADARSVTPGYLETLGATLVDGRPFDDGDIGSALPVALVDTKFAERLWPGERAVGRRVKADPGTTGRPEVMVTVVGVVRHLRHREITQDLREQMYFPAPQSFRNPMVYAVRAATDPAALTAAVRGAVAALDPSLPIYDVRPLTSYTAAARATRKFTLALTATFAVSALLLAAVGVYGVAACAAAERRREFGLRVALGARGGQIVRHVLADGLRSTLAGVAFGCAGAFAAAALLRTQLYNVAPADPAAFAAGLAAVAIASLAACLVPAWRAARASALDSLRGE